MKLLTVNKHHKWACDKNRLKNFSDDERYRASHIELLLGCSRPTALKKLNDCSSLTIKEAVSLANLTGIDPTSFFKTVKNAP